MTVTWTVGTVGTRRSVTLRSQPVGWINLGVTPRSVASNSRPDVTTRTIVATTATRRIAVCSISVLLLLDVFSINGTVNYLFVTMRRVLSVGARDRFNFEALLRSYSMHLAHRHNAFLIKIRSTSVELSL